MCITESETGRLVVFIFREAGEEETLTRRLGTRLSCAAAAALMKKVACAVLPIVKKKEGEEAYGKFRR